MLILVAVTVRTVIQSGLFGHAGEATYNYDMQQAREKLGIELSAMLTEKYTNKIYNQEDYLTEKLIEAGFEVVGNIVIVDEYQFQIDRSVPEIVDELGKGKKNEKIKIKATQNTSSDFTKVTLSIKITSEKELKSVTINGKEVTEIKKEDGQYIMQTEVSENKIVSIVAKDKEDGYNIENVRITDITEDMDISNKEDMILFREKINEGRTFENRTVRVLNNINLEGSTSNKWQAIGSEDKAFKGIFEGNNHKIENLYVDGVSGPQGLFGYNHGTIQNLEIENGYVKSTQDNTGMLVGINEGRIYHIKTSGTVIGTISTGGIVGSKNNGTIEKCLNFADVSGTVSVAGILGRGADVKFCGNYGNITGSGDSVGGICGYVPSGSIVGCYNYGTINCNGEDYEHSSAGGISGNRGLISFCYNRGNVTAYGPAGGIVGMEYCQGENCVSYSYNTASVSGSNKTGAIVGQNTGASISHCWYTIGTQSSYGGDVTDVDKISENDLKQSLDNLGREYFTEDKTNINEGYPILKWQLEN